MRVEYRGKIFDLDVADIGYEADRVRVLDSYQREIEIGGDTKEVQLFITLVDLSDNSIAKVKEIESNLKNVKDMMSAYLIVNRLPKERVAYLNNSLEIFKVVVDFEQEFGDMYGVLIEDGALKGEFVNSIFIVTKEGTLFFRDIPKNIEDEFDLNHFFFKLNSAFNCYTGISREEMGI